MQSLQRERNRLDHRTEWEGLILPQAHKGSTPSLWEPKYLFRALLWNNELNYKFALIEHGTSERFCETEVHLKRYSLLIGFSLAVIVVLLAPEVQWAQFSRVNVNCEHIINMRITKLWHMKTIILTLTAPSVTPLWHNIAQMFVFFQMFLFRQ